MDTTAPRTSLADPGAAPASGGALRGVVLALLFVVVLAAVSVPVISHPLLPLTDYVNNLSQAYIISTYGADAEFQRFYSVEWRVIPNLMMDLVVVPLHQVMDIYRAGQAFTLMILALILSGTLALHRALFRQWSPVPLAAAVLLYNEVFLVGIMNYVFGIGLALWALAAWVALRERPWALRLAVSTVFVVGLFFCHLFALGVYGLGLLAFESHRLWSRRDAPLRPRLIDFVATGVPFLAAGALLLASPTLDLAGEIRWELAGKFEGVRFVFSMYSPWVALAVAGVAALAIAAAARLHLLHLHPFGWTLLVIGGAVYLAMPRTLFATYLADQRLPVALAFMLIAAINVDLRERRVRQAGALLLAGMLALRLGEVQLSWNSLAGDLAAIHRSVASIPRGARVLTVHAAREPFQARVISDYALPHAASLATIERSAFVAGTFVVPGKHVVQARGPYAKLANLQDNLPLALSWLRAATTGADGTEGQYWTRWQNNFDYLYVLFREPGAANPDPEHLVLVAEGWGFQLYRVIRKA